jgi:hypothetical protein
MFTLQYKPVSNQFFKRENPLVEVTVNNNESKNLASVLATELEFLKSPWGPGTEEE